MNDKQEDLPPGDLQQPGHYLNRELSLLEFNRRVLEQAGDPRAPLLERLRFLAICSTNLDEFFEVRVASHRSLLEYGAEQPGPDGLSHQETLTAISASAHTLVEDQYRMLNEVLLPELRAAGIRMHRRSEWTEDQAEWIQSTFTKGIRPVLTPMGIDPAHPFPKILNKSLNFIVQLSGEDAFGRSAGVAIVQVPRALPRVMQLPPDVSSGPHDYVLLSSIIHEHIADLFPGLSVTACEQFRVTRDGDLDLDSEGDDYLKVIQGELPERRFARAVRLELSDHCPEGLAAFLLDKFELHSRDLYRVSGPVNIHRLVALHKKVDRPDLKYRTFLPRTPRRFSQRETAFSAIAHGDILLHHPYESFSPVLDLLRQAAADPDVLAIKQTLYRVGEHSPITEALIDAASNGTQVTVVIELRARFDEAHNIDLATRLQSVGANVVYGIVGYKTHAKLLMLVRREGGSLRRYVHVGTGNYHVRTARDYSDIGLLTANRHMCADVDKLFNQLTGLGRTVQLKKIIQSPFTLYDHILDLIRFEENEARKGRPGAIKARMNALTERGVIEALYRASQAGVQIELLIRGACCLRPEIPGVSENIRVVSVVGRFLEHSRVYWFLHGGEELTYCSSADWMSRNLHRRVESAFPIEDKKIKRRLLREAIDLPLSDNAQAWQLRWDGTYQRLEGEPRLSSQEILMAEMESLNTDIDEGQGNKPRKGKHKKQRRRQKK